MSISQTCRGVLLDERLPTARAKLKFQIILGHKTTQRKLGEQQLDQLVFLITAWICGEENSHSALAREVNCWYNELRTRA